MAVVHAAAWREIRRTTAAKLVTDGGAVSCRAHTHTHTHTHTQRTERERNTHSGRDKQRDRGRNGERGLFFFFYSKQDFAPSLGNGLAMEPHWLTNAWNFELPAQYHNTCEQYHNTCVCALGHVSTWEYTGLKWAVPFLFFFFFCCPKHNTQLPSACRLFCACHYPRSERSKLANKNMGFLAWEITSKVKEFHVGHVHEHCRIEHSRKGEHVNKIECFLYVTYTRVLSGKSLNQAFSIIGNTIETCFQLKPTTKSTLYSFKQIIHKVEFNYTCKQPKLVNIWDFQMYCSLSFRSLYLWLWL